MGKRVLLINPADGNETILYPSTNTLNSRAVDHTLDLANAYSFLNSKF